MHNKDYDSLSQKDKERLLHSIGKSGLDQPKGYEIDRMMRNYKPNVSQQQQQQPQRYGPSSLNRDSDTQYKGGAGPGDIPD